MSYAETIRRVSRIRFLIERACQHRLSLAVSIQYVKGIEEKKFSSKFISARWTKRKGIINIERLTPDEGNAYLSSPMALMASFSSHFVEGFCRFETEFLEFSNEGSNIRISYPRMIERFQRRITVRVAPPENEPLVVEFQSGNHTHAVNAKSVSIRGIGLILETDGCIQAGQILKRFHIHFPAGKTMTRTARINEISLIDEKRRYVSISFIDRSPAKDDLIRSYMIALSALQKK